MSDSLQPHGLYSPWNSLGQNTAVSSLSLLQGNLPNPGIKPGSPALQVDSYQLSNQGSPDVVFISEVHFSFSMLSLVLGNRILSSRGNWLQCWKSLISLLYTAYIHS